MSAHQEAADGEGGDAEGEGVVPDVLEAELHAVARPHRLHHRQVGRRHAVRHAAAGGRHHLHHNQPMLVWDSWGNFWVGWGQSKCISASAGIINISVEISE